MTKKYITALLFASCMYSGFGQNETTQKADQLYDSYQYVAAIDAYEKLVVDNEADAYVYKKLADSYYQIYDMKQAATWYSKAVESVQDAETHYRYAQTLKAAGKFEEANEQMEVFANSAPNDQRAITFLENPNYIPQLRKQKALFKESAVSLSSGEASDFAPVMANDSILYFVSTRNNSGNKTDNWTDTPYLDIYKSTLKADGTYTDAENVTDLNTNFHDGPITFSADGTTVFFARAGFTGKNYKKDKRNKVKVAQQGIYWATKKEGKWTSIQPVSFNSTEYSVSHPSLSADGKTLYFTSNMPGGFGDTDIWKVSVNNGAFGTPENLGAMVNTPGKENFPFISENQILYFSSNGKQGFGGLDVFKTDLTAATDAENIGAPVNTAHDDFSFSMNTTLNIGYFASNRNGTDHIYTAIPVCNSEIYVQVFNEENGAVLTNASVTVLDAYNNAMATQTTDAQGKVTFPIDCETAYQLQVGKETFEGTTVEVAATTEASIMKEIKLNPVERLITATEVKLGAIYFDFDKSNITQQGASELDKLVAIMKAHPQMQILIQSHTDTKGSKTYNRKLSERRAQATKQYLISKGIEETRLEAKGMGSDAPKIDCGGHCTKEQDAQNRRSEFLIQTK